MHCGYRIGHWEQQWAVLLRLHNRIAVADVEPEGIRREDGKRIWQVDSVVGTIRPDSTIAANIPSYNNNKEFGIVSDAPAVRTGNTTVVNSNARAKGARNVVMATQTKDAVTTAVTIVKTKLVRVSVYEGVDGIRYRFNFADSFPAYRRGEDGQNVLATADYVDFLPNVAIAQLINCLPELADLHVDARERAIRQGVSGGINAAQLQILCRGAEFVIERVQFAAGDPYKTYDGDDAVHEHEGFSTNIKEVKLLDKQVKLLENMQMQLLMNQLWYNGRGGE